MMSSKGKRFLEFDETNFEKVNNFDPFSTTILETPHDEKKQLFDHLVLHSGFNNTGNYQKEQFSNFDSESNNSCKQERIQKCNRLDYIELSDGPNFNGTLDINAIDNQCESLNNPCNEATDYNIIPLTTDKTVELQRETSEISTELSRTVEYESDGTGKSAVYLSLNSNSSLGSVSSGCMKASAFDCNQQSDINVKLEPINSGKTFAKREKQQSVTVKSMGSLSNQINGHDPIGGKIANNYIYTYHALNADANYGQIINVCNKANSSHLLQGFTSDESSFKDDGFPVINNHNNFIIKGENEVTVVKSRANQNDVDAYETPEIKENSYGDLYCHYGIETPDEQNCCVSKELPSISKEVITEVSESENDCIFKRQNILHSDVSKSSRHCCSDEERGVLLSKCNCFHESNIEKKVNSTEATENSKTSDIDQCSCFYEEVLKCHEGDTGIYNIDHFKRRSSDNEELIIDHDYNAIPCVGNQPDNTGLISERNEYDCTSTTVNCTTKTCIDTVVNENSESNNVNSSCNFINGTTIDTNSFNSEGSLNSRDRFFQEPLNLDPFQPAEFVYTVSDNCDIDPFGDYPFGEGDPFAIQSPDPFDTDPFGYSDEPSSYENNCSVSVLYSGSSINRPFINFDLSGPYRSVSNNSLYKILEEDEPLEGEGDDIVNKYNDSACSSLDKSCSLRNNEDNISFESELSENSDSVNCEMAYNTENGESYHQGSMKNNAITDNKHEILSCSDNGQNSCKKNISFQEVQELAVSCQESEESLILKAKTLVKYVISQAILEFQQSSSFSNDDQLPTEGDYVEEYSVKNNSSQCFAIGNLPDSSMTKVANQLPSYCSGKNSKHSIIENIDIKTDGRVINNNGKNISINYHALTESTKECIANTTEEENNTVVSFTDPFTTSSNSHFERLTQLQNHPSANDSWEHLLHSVDDIHSDVFVSTGFDNNGCSHGKLDTFNGDTVDIELNNTNCDNSQNLLTFENEKKLESKADTDLERLTTIAKVIVRQVIASAIEEIRASENDSSHYLIETTFKGDNNTFTSHEEQLLEHNDKRTNMSSNDQVVIFPLHEKNQFCDAQNIVNNVSMSVNASVIPVEIEIEECSSPEGSYGCIPPPEIQIVECSTPEISEDDEELDLIDLNSPSDDKSGDMDDWNIDESVTKEQKIPTVFIEHCSSPEWSSSPDSEEYNTGEPLHAECNSRESNNIEKRDEARWDDRNFILAVEDYIEKIIQDSVIKLKEEAMGTETEIAASRTSEDQSGNIRTAPDNISSADEESYSEEIKQLRDQIPEELASYPLPETNASKTKTNKMFNSAEESKVFANNNTIDLKSHRIEQEQSNIQRTYQSSISSNGNPIINSDFSNEVEDFPTQGNQEIISNFNSRSFKGDIDGNDLINKDVHYDNAMCDFGDEEISNYGVENLVSPSELPNVMNRNGDFPIQRELSLADELSQSMTEENEEDTATEEQSNTVNNVIDSPRIKDPQKVNVRHISKDVSVEKSSSNVANQSVVSESDSIYDRIIDKVLTSTPRKSYGDEPNLSTERKQSNSPKRKIIPNLDLLNTDDDTLDLPESPSSSSAGYSTPGKTPEDLQTPEFIKNSVFGGESNKSSPSEQIPEYSAEEEFENNRNWRTVHIGDKKCKIDMRVIEPYKKVLSHGGYYGDGFNAIIVFSGCHLPDKRRRDYQYVMDNLFLYVVSTLELLVVEDYMIVYFHGATPKNKMPNLKFLKRCYEMIDRRLRKNLKRLLIVHPTFWLKTIVLMTKPFISSKFYYKMEYVKSLQQLTKVVPCEYVFVPDEVKLYDTAKYKCDSSAPITAL